MLDGCMSTNEASWSGEGAFLGPSEFAEAVRQGIDLAGLEGWSQMVWVDVDFADWPLREKAVIESLQRWVKPGRRLTMIAKRYNQVTLLHPRFVQWRVTWGHLLDCRVVKHLDDSEMPSALLGPAWFLHRRDAERSVGVWSREPRSKLNLKESVDECFRQSSPGFPASVLGL